MTEVEAVARALHDASTEKARAESAHVVPWEGIAPHWRQIHMHSTAPAIRALDEHRAAEGMLL